MLKITHAKIDFSLLIPTRWRVELLTNLINSIKKTTYNLSAIEALIAFDLDDIPTVNLSKNIYYPWLKWYGRERGTSISRDYHNWLYKKSRGKYLIAMNDDCVFATKNWDKIIIEKMTKVKPRDGIFYGFIHDGADYYREFGSFPLVSRRAADLLGYVMHEHFTGWSADIYLANLYREVNRILSFEEVSIDHISHHTQKRGWDATNYSMVNFMSKNGWALINHMPEARRFRKLINYCINM